jgi:hypothetical protein
MLKSIFSQKLSKFLGIFTLSLIFGGSFGNLQLAPLLSQTRQKTVFDQITLSPNFNPDPGLLEGVSGGSIEAREITQQIETPTGPCLGFIDRQPDHQMTLTAFFNYLSVVIESQEDTTLIITGPGGIWCNDDYKGKNPGIAGQWQPGTYKIWVGSYKKDLYSPYLLRISQIK